jgi:hypothetical protein
MIVTIEQLRRAAGLAEDDDSQDAALIELESQSVAWIEGEVHRRFSEPILVTEIVEGRGRRELIIYGHVDLAALAESASSLEALRVQERWQGEGKDAWAILAEDVDYEFRGDILYRLGGVWSRGVEYELTYYDGYETAPLDIQALVLEMVTGGYGANQSVADGTSGITSEKIGDYSYSLGGSGTGTGGSVSGGEISDTGWKTLNRYRRKIA